MSYVQLTSEERYVIYHLKLYKLSLREIARRLGRHHSTISRELKRNGPIISTWVYWHQGAHEQALKRRKQARHYRRYTHAPLTVNSHCNRTTASFHEDLMRCPIVEAFARAMIQLFYYLRKCFFGYPPKVHPLREVSA